MIVNIKIEPFIIAKYNHGLEPTILFKVKIIIRKFNMIVLDIIKLVCSFINVLNLVDLSISTHVKTKVVQI